MPQKVYTVPIFLDHVDTKTVDYPLDIACHMVFSNPNSDLFLILHPKQDVLEKFEYFPVKCRIQRAAEGFANARKRQEEEKHNNIFKPFKTKVTSAAFHPFFQELT